jgi:hypothetical protein
MSQPLKRISVLGGMLFSTLLGIVSVIVVPVGVSAVCEYGNCSPPSGYCVLGVCREKNVPYVSWYDGDTCRGYCQHDICYLWEQCFDGSCPAESQTTCYTGDNFWCASTECGDIGASCSFSGDCCSGNCGQETGICGGMSPIVIDLRNDSVQDNLTSAEGGVLFDLQDIGSPVRPAWTSARSSVGFLVRDVNGNGRIDSGAEMFGDATVLRDGSHAANGFKALADLDDNHDGVIDVRDAVFTQLRIWVDSNHDGVSQAQELSTLDSAGIMAVSTSYAETPRVDRFGNWYRYSGQVVTSRGQERRVYDVIFASGS